MERLKLNIQLFASRSGNITTGVNEDGTTFYLNWQQTTQGIDSQGRPYTKINWQIGINARYTYYSNAVSMGATTINGVQVHGGGTWSDISSGTTQLASGSTTIYHNSNGTKSFSASISGWTIGCSWVSKSGSWELTRIPTASKVDSVTFDLDSQNRPDNIEESFNVVFTRYDSSFTDNLVMTIRGNIIRRIENYTSGDTISFTQTELNSLYTEMYAENSSTIKFYLETYSGETLIGTSDEFGKIVNIYDADPTFSGVTFEDTNSTTTALTGNNQIIIKGYSNATITIPVATGNKGATIVDYVIDGVDNPITHTGSPLTYTINGCTFGTFNVYARDSRGNTKLSTVIASSTKSYEKIYLDVSESKIERWDNDRASATGNEAKLTLSGTIWNNNFGSVNNSITSSEYRLKITDDSGDPVLGTTDITPTINQDGTITFSDEIRSDNPDYSWNIGDSYYIYITVADRLSSASIVLTLNSAKPNIAIHKNGVGIGAAYDTSVGGSLQVDGQRIDPVVDSLDGSSTTNAPSVRAVNEGLGLRQYEPVSLYTNTSGETGTVNLSDNSTNYKYLEIFCVDTNGVGSSTKIQDPNGKKVNLMTAHIDTGIIQFYTKNVLINTTSITVVGGYTVRLQYNSITAYNNSNNYIRITKVIGYK